MVCNIIESYFFVKNRSSRWGIRMQIQRFFLILLLIVSSSLIYCSSLEDAVKKSHKSVSFDAHTKRNDGGLKPQRLTSHRVKYLDYAADEDSDEEVSVTNDSDDEVTVEADGHCPFSIAPQKREVVADDKLSRLQTEIKRIPTFREYYAKRRANEAAAREVVKFNEARCELSQNPIQVMLNCCAIQGEGREDKSQG